MLVRPLAAHSSELGHPHPHANWASWPLEAYLNGHKLNKKQEFTRASVVQIGLRRRRGVGDINPL